MRKHFGKLLLTALLFVGIFQLTTSSETNAQSINELEKEKQEVNEEHQGVKGELDQAKDRLNDIKQKQQNTQSEINELDQEATDTQNQIDSKIEELEQKENEINTKQSEIDELTNEINELESRIEELQEEIKQLKEEIEVLQEEIKEQEASIEKREELLKDRLRSLQKNGGDIRYLEVILGSKNFGDFINRTVAVNKIMEQDNNILDTHIQEKKDLENNKVKVEENKEQVEDNKTQVEKDKEEVTAQRRVLSDEKKSLENQKSSLTAEKTELDNLFVELEDQLGMKDTRMAELDEQEEEFNELTMSLEEQEENLRSQKAAFDKLIAIEKEKEKERQQAANNSNNGSSGGNSNAKENVEQVASSSGFIRPTTGRVSSGFGYRTHPLSGTRSFHYGVDLAGGSVPVKAAADGVVTRAYYSSSYGNTVIIAHNINGQEYTTLYAHLRSSPSVSTGQVVSQGQFLGNQGNTGASAGIHLHFEVHTGPWNASKSNAVNPLNYIPR